MCGKYSLTKIANFLIIVLRAEIVTTFGSRMVGTSARNYISKAIFSVFYNISPPNIGILLLLKGSFREFRFICLDLPRLKISLLCKLSIQTTGHKNK